VIYLTLILCVCILLLFYIVSAFLCEINVYVMSIFNVMLNTDELKVIIDLCMHSVFLIFRHHNN